MEEGWSILIGASAIDQVRMISISTNSAAPVVKCAPNVVEELGKDVALFEQVSQDNGNVVREVCAERLVQEMRNSELLAKFRPNEKREKGFTGFKHHSSCWRSALLGWRH
jgi:hypothetical protein